MIRHIREKSEQIRPIMIRPVRADPSRMMRPVPSDGNQMQLVVPFLLMIELPPPPSPPPPPPPPPASTQSTPILCTVRIAIHTLNHIFLTNFYATKKTIFLLLLKYTR